MHLYCSLILGSGGFGFWAASWALGVLGVLLWTLFERLASGSDCLFVYTRGTQCQIPLNFVMQRWTRVLDGKTVQTLLCLALFFLLCFTFAFLYFALFSFALLYSELSDDLRDREREGACERRWRSRASQTSWNVGSRDFVRMTRRPKGTTGRRGDGGDGNALMRFFFGCLDFHVNVLDCDDEDDHTDRDNCWPPPPAGHHHHCYTTISSWEFLLPQLAVSLIRRMANGFEPNGYGMCHNQPCCGVCKCVWHPSEITIWCNTRK